MVETTDYSSKIRVLCVATEEAAHTGYYMSELYRRYFQTTDFNELEKEIGNTRQEVWNCLDQMQRRELMHLVDAQDQLEVNLTQASFGTGLRLAMGLLQEVEMKRVRLELREEGQT